MIDENKLVTLLVALKERFGPLSEWVEETNPTGNRKEYDEFLKEMAAHLGSTPSECDDQIIIAVGRWDDPAVQAALDRQHYVKLLGGWLLDNMLQTGADKAFACVGIVWRAGKEGVPFQAIEEFVKKQEVLYNKTIFSSSKEFIIFCLGQLLTAPPSLINKGDIKNIKNVLIEASRD